MNWLDKLERKLGRRFGIDHLMVYITATMLAVYLLQVVAGRNLTYFLMFSRSHLLQGEVWRLVSFVFVPPSDSPLWLVIALYFYYFIGESLENAWGRSQFTLYYIFGIIGTIIAGFLTGFATNSYLNLSLFFAFAQLFPNHQLLLFFIIPIKVKYLALVSWIFFGISFLSSLVAADWVSCASILASILNFLLFFGPDFWNRFKNYRKYGSSRRNFKKQMKDNPWGY